MDADNESRTASAAAEDTQSDKKKTNKQNKTKQEIEKKI